MRVLFAWLLLVGVVAAVGAAAATHETPSATGVRARRTKPGAASSAHTPLAQAMREAEGGAGADTTAFVAVGTRDAIELDFPFYSQADPQWGSIRLSRSSSDRMSRVGCLTTALAMGLAGKGVNICAQGTNCETTTPGTLAQTFLRDGGYDSRARYRWGSLERVTQGKVKLLHRKKTPCSRPVVEHYLREGHFIVAQVNHILRSGTENSFRSTRMHFDLITGVTEGNFFMVNDPATRTGARTQLPINFCVNMNVYSVEDGAAVTRVDREGEDPSSATLQATGSGNDASATGHTPVFVAQDNAPIRQSDLTADPAAPAKRHQPGDPAMSFKNTPEVQPDKLGDGDSNDGLVRMQRYYRDMYLAPLRKQGVAIPGDENNESGRTAAATARTTADGNPLAPGLQLTAHTGSGQNAGIRFSGSFGAGHGTTASLTATT